jgi:hypothetical protein
MAKFGLVRAEGYHMGFDKRRLQRFCFYGYNNKKEAFPCIQTLMFCCNSQLSKNLSICMKKNLKLN